MSVATLGNRTLRLTALLQIDGLRECFYMGPQAPPAPAHAGLGAVTYAVHPGLDAFSAVSSSVSLTDAVPSAGRVTVQVGIAPDEAARQLLRLVPTGAPGWTTIADSLPATQNGAPLVVQCADSVATLTVPGLAWVGREAVYLSARNVGAQTVTIATNGRGQLGTLIEAHSASAPSGWAPRLYSACVAWRRRRARIWVGQLTAAGTWLTPPVVEVEGWMPAPPAAIGARTVSLEIETLPAALDVEVGAAPSETGFQAGWHLFDGFIGNRWDCLSQVWGEGQVYAASPSAGAGIGAGSYSGAPGALGEVFMGSTVSLYAGLRGSIVRASNDPEAIYLDSVTVAGGDTDDPGGTINVSPNLPFGLTTNTRLRNGRAEVQALYVFGTAGVPEVVAWPPGAGFNSTLDSQPDAGWVNHYLDPSGTLTLTPLWSVGVVGALNLRLIAPTVQTCWGLCIGTAMPRLQGGRVQAESWPQFAPRGRWDAADRRPRNGAAIPAEYILGNSGEVIIQLGAIADAWWQPPERYLLVADDVLPGASPTTPLPLLVVHEPEGEEVRTVLRIIGSQAASVITPGAAGFALEVHPEDRFGFAIADMPGARPATMRAAAAWTRTSPGRIIRQLAASVSGTGANGPSDVQPYGAAIPADLLDTASFAAMPSGAAGLRTALLDEGGTPREIISSLARSIGAMLVERLNRNTGRRQLALVPAGLPTPFEVVDSLTDGDWLADQRPVMSIDEAVINRAEFELSTATLISYGRQLPKGATYTVTVTDRDSAGEQGGATTEAISLLGVVADASSAAALRDLVVPLAQSRFAAYGYPRRQFSGAVAYGRGVGLDAGAVVRVAGAELLAYNGQPIGSGGAIARITSVERDVVAQRCRITGTYWEATTAGWAPAMRVSFVAGAVATVVDNYYSPTASATGTPQIDSSFFSVGDSVVCVPRGNRGAASTLTIVSFGAGTVTLSGALPAGMVAGSIRLASYATATPVQRGHCFLADAALTIPLSAGSDPAQRYT